MGEKMHCMRSAGVTLDVLPPCVCSHAVFSNIFTFACDAKWQECATACGLANVRWEMGTDADAEIVAQVQKQAGVLFLSEFVRWMAAGKLADILVLAKLVEYSIEICKDSAEPLRTIANALATVIKNDADLGVLRQAPSLAFR